MTGLIRFGRVFKAWFFKLKLHFLLQPFNGFLLKLLYLSRLSAWCSQHSNLSFKPQDLKFDYVRRYDLYNFVLDAEALQGPITYLEFGVGRGNSFKWWVENNQHPESRFAGFDTFTGLPEGWGGLKSGAFSTGGNVPDLDDKRADFEKGLFQETLPSFIKSHNFQNRIVLHMDADLYSSTLFVLTTLAQHLKPGDLILFDEFAVPTHEFKAFSEFVAAFGMKYEVLGAVNNFMQVAMKVK